MTSLTGPTRAVRGSCRICGSLGLAPPGPEFGEKIETVAALFGMVHEVVPKGAKWRMGLAERHGAIVKLMMMRMVAAMQLTCQVALRQACLAAFAAKNRTVNKGGVSPMQAV